MVLLIQSASQQNHQLNTTPVTNGLLTTITTIYWSLHFPRSIIDKMTSSRSSRRKADSAIKKIKRLVRQDMSRFQVLTLLPIISHSPLTSLSQNIDKGGPSQRKPKAPSPEPTNGPLPPTAPTLRKISLSTPAPPSAILTLTIIAPPEVQTWREAFILVLEELDKTERLLDKIVDLEYTDKEVNGVMMVQALALCVSIEDAGVVMRCLRDVEVAGDVLWPCYARAEQKAVKGGARA